MESSTLNEKIYYKNDFSIKIRFNDNLFLIVASDMTQGLIYMNTLTNQNISEYSSLLFSKISDFSKFFIDNFESSPYIKFNKKEISIFVKIDFTHPIKKTISFSIPLKPQSGILFFRTLESEIETLNSRLKAIESKTENLNGFQNFASTLCKLDSLLSQITPKVHPKSFSDHPEEKRSYKKIKKNPAEEMQTKNDNFVSPVINTIENLDSSINGDPFNGMTDKILSEKKRNNGKLDFCFNSIHSLNFYEFSQDNKRITRTSIYKKQHFLCWGNFPLSKVCSQKFSIKIERISPESETINGTIGIMTSEVLGKINNLAEHSGIGCYLFGTSTNLLWINNDKINVQKKIGNKGDVIKVEINWDECLIRWSTEWEEVGVGKIDRGQIQEWDFYPVVTLANPKESVIIMSGDELIE